MLCAGCAASRATLDVRREDSGQTLTKSFDRAYFAIREAGEYDIVLIDDGYGQTPHPSPSRPGAALEPMLQSPLRQVVHIHVLWRPVVTRGIDNVAGTNATLQWKVTGDSGKSPSTLVYGGAGYVSLHPRGNTAKVVVRGCSIVVKTLQGDLHDPVGNATLSGVFWCERNDSLVDATLSELRQ